MGERPRPEDLADYRSIREERLRAGLERVQARGDQGLNRIGEGNFRACPQLPARALPGEKVAIPEQPHELLRVERVAARTLEDRPLQLGR